jgi:hypothetical protein
MSQSLLLAFLVFAAVMSFTPGPNNIMLLSSGLTYGFRRTLPLMAGILLGGTFMIGAVGLGLGAVFFAYPVLKTILKYAGAAYLIYLAAGIAMSGTTASEAGRQARPDDVLGRGAVPMDQCQGVGDDHRNHHRLCRHCRLSLEYRDPDRHLPDDRDRGDHQLGAVRQFAAADPDFAAQGAGLQHRDGAAAAVFALSGFHGRMMPHRVMREKGFP